MILILGTKEPSVRLYQSVPEEERKYVELCVFPGLGTKADAGGYPAVTLSETDPAKIGQVIIPTYGINIVKRARKMLKETCGSGDRQCLVISPEVFAREMITCGSLQALIARRKEHIPYINSVEFEVAHHCNLNCRGCNHFSPLSERKFGDLESFRRDLTRLHEFVDHIGELRLVGGEPLLNPELPKFVKTAREIFREDPLTVITNGILMASPDRKLLDVMRETDACFSVTLYPPVKNFVKEMAEKLRNEGIRVEVFSEVTQFSAQLNPDGDSDPGMAESICFSSECHMIENGRINKCTVSGKCSVFERYYGLEGRFPDCYIDLHDRELTAEKLYSYLLNPIPMCAFCGKWKLFDWARAGEKPPMDDWIGAGKYQVFNSLTN